MNIIISSPETRISIITGIAAFSIYFMISSATLANPLIADNFNLGTTEMGFVIQAHLLGAVMFLIPAAKLGDIYSHIRIFSSGAIIFAATSFFCSVSVSGAEMILFRLIQGMGDGMMTATALVLLTKVYRSESRGKAIGFFLFAGYFGYITGMSAGCIFADILGWHSVFLAAALFSSIAGMLGFKSKTIFNFEKDTQKKKFDTKGMILFCPAIVFVTAGISGFIPDLRILFITIGAVLFVFFAEAEKNSENPLFCFSVFKRNRVFSFSICADFLYYMTIGCITYILSIYLESGLYYSAFAAGMLIIPVSLMQGALSPFAGYLSDKFEPRYITATGMAVIVITLLFFANAAENGAEPILISFMLAVTGTGYALFSSPNKNAIMGSVKARFHGEASGIANTFEQMGNIASISIAAMIITHFAGNTKITPDALPHFLEGMQMVFLVMALIGAVNIIICLKRGDIRKRYPD